MKFKESIKKKAKASNSKCKIWKLKEKDKQRMFQQGVEAKVVMRGNGGVEATWQATWQGLKECLVGTADEVCGRTRGPPRHKETWWWNDDVEKAVAEKR